MHVNAPSNEQVQLFIHELIDPFQSSALIIGEQMVSTRRAPCESRGHAGSGGGRGKREREEIEKEEGTGCTRLDSSPLVHGVKYTLAFRITRVRELKRERERERWLRRRKVRKKRYIYICYKSRAKRKWREKKRRERVTGAKISDLDHTHARKKKEDGRKRDGE